MNRIVRFPLWLFVERRAAPSTGRPAFGAKDTLMWASQLGTVEELGDWSNHSRTLRIRPSLTRRHNGGILFGGCVDLEAGRSTILRDHPRARGEPPRLADLIVGREVGCLEDRGEVQEG